MNTNLSKLFSIALILSLILSGCAAVSTGSGAAMNPQVVLLGAGETVQGLQRVMNGIPGTFVMIDATESVLMFAWPKGENYAFCLLGRDGSLLTANATRAYTVQLALGMKSMIANGWRVIDRDQIPSFVGRQVAAAVALMASEASSMMPTIILLPAIWVGPKGAIDG